MKATIIFGMLGISALAFASIADDFKDASNRDGLRGDSLLVRTQLLQLGRPRRRRLVQEL
jgi:hypothetical protein